MSKKIELEFSTDEINVLEASAKAHNMDLTEFIRNLIRYSMNKTTH